jgi:hypothetical protein
VGTIAGGLADQGGDQALDLVAGQRDQAQRWWVAGVLGDRGDHQEGARQHGQGHPPVPAAPAGPPRPPTRAPASGGPARAWSQTRPGRERQRPDSAQDRQASLGAGTAPGRSPRARHRWRRPGRQRPGRCRPCRRSRCTGVAPPPSGRPSSDPRLVDHQHRLGVGQVFDQVVTHGIADGVLVPDRPANRCCIPSGVAWPACSAIVQQFFLGRSASSWQSSDSAVEPPSTDHLRQRLPRRTRSSEPTADFLAPTPLNPQRGRGRDASPAPSTFTLTSGSTFYVGLATRPGTREVPS